MSQITLHREIKRKITEISSTKTFNELIDSTILSSEEKAIIDDIYIKKLTLFAIAEKLEYGAIDVKTKFMTYDEMDCFFMGMMVMKENRINF